MEKVIMGTRLPAKLWLNEVEDSCMSQIMDLTSLPFAFKHIAIMPDAHAGKGMPIGGVLATKGMIIYGVAIGFLTVVIRLFGAYPEGMSFAIFIMNAFTPLINTYCKPKRFGEVVKK